MEFYTEKKNAVFEAIKIAEINIEEKGYHVLETSYTVDAKNGNIEVKLKIE
jgi:hypothetical protein